MSGEALRILHVLDHSLPLHSGYTFRTRAILDGQRALGWKTEHVTGGKQLGTEAAVEQIDGLRFYRTAAVKAPIRDLPVLGQLGIVWGLARRLAELAQALRPDLIHAHSPALNGAAAALVARRLGVPWVYEVRAFWEDAAVDHGTSRAGGLRYRASRALESWVLRRADAVTTICEGLRGEICSRGVSPRRVTVIPNGVDADRFALRGAPDPALISATGLDGAHAVLGFIGSFYGYEGLELLLRALPAIRECGGDVRVLLVGGGPELERLRALAQASGIARWVSFPGRVPHAEVGRYYDLIDLLVYPRHAMRLTELVTPLKPLEAMAQGRVVVASDVGGHRELIRDGDTGVLFPAGSVEGLAGAVQVLLADRERWPALGRRARAAVAAERDWRAIVARYREVYSQALGRPVA